VVAAEPSRRAVIAATAATAALPLLAAGCRGTAALGTPPRPAPDVALLRDAIEAEDAMVASYQAAVRQVHGGRAVTLARLLAEHEQHARQLRARLIRGSPLAAGSAPLPRPTEPVLPSAPHQVIAYLSRAERAAAQRLLGQVPRVPPALAQLFASISASEATHVPALRAAGTT
jgi:hypothetical protein